MGLATTPLSGPLIDRFGSLAVFVAGLLVGGLGIGMFALATNLPVAYAPRPCTASAAA